MLRFLVIATAAFVLVGTTLIGGYAYDAYLSSPKADARTVSFVMPQGGDASGVARLLKEQGLVESAFFFKTYVRLSGADRALQDGTFELKPGMSFSAIVGVLTHAESNEVQITIPEGFTLKQIGERVRAELPHVTEDDWNAAVGGASPLEAHAFVVAAGKPDDVDLEGYLFPDTYRFFTDATAEDVAAKMVGAMEKKFTGTLVPSSSNATKVAMNTHELLTLASIIEREVQRAEDMKYVADIFLSRLEIGMPLQADSTISYYLGKTSAELTTDDLKADEPFNTYTRAGLPPGPIASPGMNAIDAVVAPTGNPYLYFLTASDGTVVYASTFEEHVANKNRYLR